jgi:geranylgeranyl diphosphate synthase type I
MCSGQGRDIAFEAEPRVTMEDYRAMIGGKTGALFGAACELGALAAGADSARAAAYARMGSAYGTAFQIEDDVLGTWGDSAATGKPCGADLAKRKWTFPVVWALAGPPSEARETLAAGYARGSALSPADVAAAVAALDRLGAREAALCASRSELAGADAVAAEHGIDRSGRVRSFFHHAARRVA